MSFQFEKKEAFFKIHSKKPFEIQKKDDDKKKIGPVLDGYNALILSKCELPDEVVKIQINDQEIENVDQEELVYFENLTCIQAEMNKLNLHNFFCLKNLRELSLVKNGITLIPDIKENFINLEKLDLSFNNIQNLQALAQIQSLEVLSLAGNQITQIPIHFEFLQRIRELNLGFNEISEESCLNIWEILSRMSSLKILKLNNNKFQTIQENAETMEKFTLSYLDLSKNDFREEVDLICLLDMKKIEFIDLSQNEKLIGKKELFSKLKRKFSIKIQSSQLQNFKRKTFHNYQTVKLENIKLPNYNEFFKTKKELFGVIVDLNENKEKENKEQNSKGNMFLTNVPNQQILKKQKTLKNLFSPDNVSQQEIMILAKYLLGNENIKSQKSVLRAYADLNKYFQLIIIKS